jgi:protein arginine N-methyltransferase 1
MGDRTPDYYFDSYSAFEVHEVMLKDTVRTNSYRMAIRDNPSLFSNAVVLDVGCGTGILSLFAASSGARKVYGVDNSAMSEYARRIVAANGMSDIVEIIHGTIEETVLPEQVDVVLSEWMGYCLLYESMLPSVISARDRLMLPGGTMFPNRARMFITGLSDEEYVGRKFGFWDDICGFNLRVLKEAALVEPLVAVAPEKDIVTDDCQLVEFDLSTVTAEQLKFASLFCLTPLESSNLTAFVVWFEVVFEGPDAQVVLSTSAFKEQTHWSQTIFYLPAVVELEMDVPLKGTFVIGPNARNPRDQDVAITFAYDGETKTYGYKMK